MTKRTQAAPAAQPTEATAANEAGQVLAQAEQPGEAQGLAESAAEEAAHLARLNATAAEGEPEGGPHLVDTAEPPAVNLEAELSALLRVGVAVLGPMFPSLREIYTNETIQTVGAVVAPVCRKNGWLSQGVGGKYAEEMAAGAVLLPLAVATYAGVSADLEARKAAQRKDPEPLPDLTANSAPAPAAAPAPEKRVTFGAAQPEAVPA